MTMGQRAGEALPVPPAFVRGPVYGPGLLVAALMLAVYGILGLTVDFPRAAIGIQSDEATYYMMGHSLATDGDLTYRREDLVRVWHEFPSGPAGVFLKKGRDVRRIGLMLRPPFIWTTTRPDPDPDRYFYGKSFAYPLLAAPFIRLAGTNGFLVLNAILMAVAAFSGYVFLQARMRPAVAAVLAGGFVMGSIVPVYDVWIAPELLNFTLGVAAYTCWLYKEAAPSASMTRRTRWLFDTRSDVVAALLLGFATFSKASNALLAPPIVLWQLWHRRWRAAAATGLIFGVMSIGLFGVNMAITGEWNYQGGERRTFYGEFPLQTPSAGIDVGSAKSRSDALTEIIFNRDVFWTNLGHNVVYAFIGRYAGLAPYFFPAVFALVAYLAGIRRRPAWQGLALAGGVAQLLFFLIVTPYTWNGGGGSVGNRYFLGAYGAFLFLLPPIGSIRLALVPWIVGSIFVAPLVMNPFVASFYPGRNADQGPLRLLPPELTLVYDLPINTEASRVKQPFGGTGGPTDPGFQIYFFDTHAYGQELDKSFWVKGRSRSELLIKTDRPVRRLVLTLTAGSAATDVAARFGGETERVSLEPGGTAQLRFALGEGFPVPGAMVRLDGMDLEQQRVRAGARGTTEHRHPVSGRARQADGRRMTIRSVVSVRPGCGRVDPCA